jgi:DNA-3-methyladenine glycosylase
MTFRKAINDIGAMPLVLGRCPLYWLALRWGVAATARQTAKPWQVEPMPNLECSKLPREFYTRPNVVTVARELLGKLLVVPKRDGTRVSGIIVETEAYRGPQDRAAHSYGGRRTKRTETMYGIGGTAYVFFVYGMYYQFNVVTNAASHPHAVLIRAVEPVEGIELMRKCRHGQSDHNLTNGPGKLCIAMGIDRKLDAADLLGNRVWLEAGRTVTRSQIASGPRIGIDYAEGWRDKPWRFWIRDNPFVSRR